MTGMIQSSAMFYVKKPDGRRIHHIRFPKGERRVPFLLVDLLTFLNYHVFGLSSSAKLRNFQPFSIVRI